VTRHSVATACFARSADTKANFVTRSPWRKKPPPCAGSPPPLQAASLRAELWAEVGDELTGRRRRIVGVFAPPLLQQRSDTPCPMLPSSSCFSQGRLLTRSPRCCATERAPYWRKRSRPRSPSSSPSTPI